MSNESSMKIARLFALAYADEPCRICGRLLKEIDISKGAVFTGYGDGMRAAHYRCWRGFVDVASDFGLDVEKVVEEMRRLKNEE